MNRLTIGEQKCASSATTSRPNPAEMSPTARTALGEFATGIRQAQAEPSGTAPGTTPTWVVVVDGTVVVG